MPVTLNLKLVHSNFILITIQHLIEFTDCFMHLGYYLNVVPKYVIVHLLANHFTLNFRCYSLNLILEHLLFLQVLPHYFHFNELDLKLPNC